MRRLARTTRLPDAIAAGDPILQTTGATVDLGGRSVVRAVDFEIRAGEVVALVGPNGSGKSTLLAGLAGDLTLSAGAVDLHGAPLASWTHGELAMRRAVLPQHPIVTFPFTVGQIVRMGRAPWAGTPHADDDDREIRVALDATNVRAFRQRAYTSLSGGEQARVMLARVFAQGAQLLMLDEPTAALDLHYQETTLEMARARAVAGDAVLLVLHDLGAAAACADRIVLLSNGRVAAAGSPEQILEPGLLADVYGHDIEVMRHPETGELLVLPRRAWISGH